MNIPEQIGGVPVKVAAPILIAAAAFVGWKYYQNRSAPADTPATDTGDFGAVDGTVPGVLGAVSPTNSYGSPDTTAAVDHSGDPRYFTADPQWTDYVSEKLQQSDTWSYTDIVTALGNYLGSKPMTDTQKTIAQAAIAVGGYPPSGAKSIVSGGNSSLSVAPTGVRVQSVAQTSAVVAFNGVPGAAHYAVLIDGINATTGAGAGSPINVGNLSPNRSYTAHVVAYTAANVVSPKSAGVTIKTTGYALATPGRPGVSSITKSNVRAAVPAIAHADQYEWFVDGHLHAASHAPYVTLAGLSSRHKYTVACRAVMAGNTVSPMSAATSFTTK